MSLRQTDTLSMVLSAFNPSTQEAMASGYLARKASLACTVSPRPPTAMYCHPDTEMAQQLIALDALPKDRVLVSSRHWEVRTICNPSLQASEGTRRIKLHR